MNPKWTVRFDRIIGRRLYPIHRRVYVVTGGLVGHRSGAGPILLLTTTGRRSGQARTTPLLYMPDGAGFLVVGSNGGRDRPPAWLLNLEARPEATVQVRRKKQAVSAEIIRRPEADDLWPLLAQHYEGWRYYQELTDREIPVVRLLPVH